MFQTTNQKGGGLLHSGQFFSKTCVKQIVEASGMVFHGYITVHPKKGQTQSQKVALRNHSLWKTEFQWSQLLWLI